MPLNSPEKIRHIGLIKGCAKVILVRYGILRCPRGEMSPRPPYDLLQIDVSMDRLLFLKFPAKNQTKLKQKQYYIFVLLT